MSEKDKLREEIERLRAELETVKLERDEAHKLVESECAYGYCNLPTCWRYAEGSECGGHTVAEWERYKGWITKDE